MEKKIYLAIDIGAGSGRVMAGIHDGKTLAIEEVNRFANEGVRLPSGWHWNTTQLFTDVKRGLTAAAKKYGASIVSVSADTWGVDFALLDNHGALLGLPYMYRDDRTDGMIELSKTIMPHDEIYRRTGVQFLFFNTLFQLLAKAQKGSPALTSAESLLFMPDLLLYWLSGVQVNERTISSTAQLLKAGTAEWDFDLISAMGIPTRLFGKVTDPGTTIGTLLPYVAEETGCGPISVVACGGHDTASAVAGTPATTAQPLFLSSGTWSLLGRELPAALVNDEVHAGGFSNEQGLNGTTRFLKNVAGMWLLQECKRQWDAQGLGLDYGSLVDQARNAVTGTWIDPDFEGFQKPCDMPAAICAYAESTGQPVPSGPGEITRVILESLALKYGSLVRQMTEWMPDLPDTLHIVGGGCQNELLNQMTADATGLRVLAGPVEATAAGNVLAQMIASGEIASLEEGRALIGASFQLKAYEPDPAASWLKKAVSK